nr:glycosyltransferase 61 family protein [Trichodesmium sp. MO_231.B1]
EYFQPYNRRLEEYLGMKFNWEDIPDQEKVESAILEKPQQLQLSSELKFKQSKEYLDNYTKRMDNLIAKNHISPTKPVVDLPVINNQNQESIERVYIRGCPRSGNTLMLYICGAGFKNSLILEPERIPFKENSIPGKITFGKLPRPEMHKKKRVRADNFLEFKDAAIIFMMRDPRDVMLSEHGRKIGEPWLKDPKWWIINALLCKELERHPRVVVVKYEELLTTPNQVQEKIATTLGLDIAIPFSECWMKFNPNPNNMNALKGVRPLDPSRIGSWKQDLSKREYIENLLNTRPEIFPLMEYFGYNPVDMSEPKEKDALQSSPSISHPVSINITENNRLFQIQNAIVKPVSSFKPSKWVGGVVFPKDMPGKFRHRRPKIEKGMKYQDVVMEVDADINNSKFYPGTYIYGGCLSPHFGHALTEGIHRLWAFNTNIYDGIVFAVLSGKKTNYTPTKWFVEALEILEIPLTKCIWVTSICTFENLIIPEPGSELTLGPKDWYRSYLEKLQQRILDATYHLRRDQEELKIFLGRNHIPFGTYIAGEKYLESLLVDEGYISLQPENYSMLEQIAYLLNAKKIIFSEGSAIYSLEFLNYLDAEIVCIPRRTNNQLYYPHISSKCRNYIVAGNFDNILKFGSYKKDGSRRILISQHPYQVVESLRNYDFAGLKDWEEEKFLVQERCDIMTYIYQVHSKFKKFDYTRYLEIIKGYLQVRTNKNETSNFHRDYQSIVLKKRSDRLNELAQINQSSNYLEIGVAQGKTFNEIKIENKVAVDPKFGFNTKKYATENIVFLEITSDEFFRNYAKDLSLFDLIYLDGLHTFEQTFRDFCASISLAHGKTIWLIDDTCPGSYAQAQPLHQNCVKLRENSQEKSRNWMGDVFKIVAAIHDFFPQFSFATFPDHGQTVIWNEWRKDFQPKWNSLETISRLEYFDFVELQQTLFKRESYEKIFQSIKSAINSQ